MPIQKPALFNRCCGSHLHGINLHIDMLHNEFRRYNTTASQAELKGVTLRDVEACNCRRVTT